MAHEKKIKEMDKRDGVFSVRLIQPGVPYIFRGGKGGAMVMVDNSITINEYNLNHQKRILSKPILLPSAFHARPVLLLKT